MNLQFNESQNRHTVISSISKAIGHKTDTNPKMLQIANKSLYLIVPGHVHCLLVTFKVMCELLTSHWEEGDDRSSLVFYFILNSFQRYMMHVHVLLLTECGDFFN